MLLERGAELLNVASLVKLDDVAGESPVLVGSVGIHEGLFFNSLPRESVLLDCFQQLPPHSLLLLSHFLLRTMVIHQQLLEMIKPHNANFLNIAKKVGMGFIFSIKKNVLNFLICCGNSSEIGLGKWVERVL